MIWLDPIELTVEVGSGVVDIRGVVDARGTKEILIEVIRRVDGVVGVEDRVGYRFDDRKIGTGPLPAAR